MLSGVTAPQRIVSLVPSTTESVVAFGGGPRLVGCTRWCTEPAAALAGVARVGGTKNPAREQIAQLRPDLVLVNAEENRREDIAWLRDRFVVLEQTPCTVAAAVAALAELAVALGDAATTAAAPLLATLRAEAIEGASAALPAVPLRVFYAVWCKPWMGVGRGTFVADVLRRAGAAPVTLGAPARYPEVAPPLLVGAGLDAVLLPSEPWAFDATQRDELAAAGTFGAAPLALCDGRDFCWHGVHMATGLPRARAAVAALRRRGGR